MVEAKGLILQIATGQETGHNAAFVRKFATLQAFGEWLAEQCNEEQIIMLTSIEVI